MDSAHDDDVVFELLGNPGEGKGVAYEISEVLDFADGIVVGQDDCILFFLESFNLFDEIDRLVDRGIHEPFFNIHLFIGFLF